MQGRLFVGVILVAVGLLLGLDAAEVVDGAGLIADWWPLVFIAGAVFMFVANPRRRLVPAIVFIIAVVVLLDTTGYVEANLWAFAGPVILVVIGLSFLFGRRGGTADTSSDDRLDRFFLFSGAEIDVSSDRFAGGSISALFGGAEIDLRHARLAEGASLDVFAMFGGIEVTVPPDWRVEVSGFPLFGGLESASPASLAPDAPRLDVHAFVMFGGIEIKR